MNKKQKIATIVFLILFWVTCFHIPWMTKRLSNGREVVDYKIGNIFQAPQNMEEFPNISSDIVFTWSALLINYGIILALCSNTKKGEYTSQEEEKNR